MISGTYEGLRLRQAAGVLDVTLDHPPLNLLDRTLFPSLVRLAADVEGDADTRVVVLRSAVPGFFIAHFDVELILGFPAPTGPAVPAAELHQFHSMVERFRTMPKATIAVIEGRVGGGGAELAASCDLRIAALGMAILNQPEVALGILPGGSGTARLGRLLGRSRALEVILGCDDVDAATAERWGWVNRALPPEEVGAFVERLAERIAGFPHHAVAAAKACVLRAEKQVVPDLRAEAAAFDAVRVHPDAEAAMRAFLAAGGQTVEGESRLGALVVEI